MSHKFFRSIDVKEGKRHFFIWGIQMHGAGVSSLVCITKAPKKMDGCEAHDQVRFLLRSQAKRSFYTNCTGTGYITVSIDSVIVDSISKFFGPLLIQQALEQEYPDKKVVFK